MCFIGEVTNHVVYSLDSRAPIHYVAQLLPRIQELLVSLLIVPLSTTLNTIKQTTRLPKKALVDNLRRNKAASVLKLVIFLQKNTTTMVKFYLIYFLVRADRF